RAIHVAIDLRVVRPLLEHLAETKGQPEANFEPARQFVPDSAQRLKDAAQYLLAAVRARLVTMLDFLALPLKEIMKFGSVGVVSQLQERRGDIVLDMVPQRRGDCETRHSPEFSYQPRDVLPAAAVREY